MRLLRNRTLLASLALAFVVASGCQTNDTFIQLGIKFDPAATPPDVFQLQVDLVEEGNSRHSTLMFPEVASPTPLMFPATAVIVLPPEIQAGAFDITVTPLDQSGSPVANTEPGTVTGVPITPGGGRDTGVILNVRAPLAGLYAPCTMGAQCDTVNGQVCAGLGVVMTAPNHFCTLKGCDPANGGTTDVRCTSSTGKVGQCFDFGAANGGALCLVPCSADADCPAAQACNTSIGACFSACTGDTDCQTGTHCSGASEDRQLCK
jgi:hypothetical protein